MRRLAQASQLPYTFFTVTAVVKKIIDEVRALGSDERRELEEALKEIPPATSPQLREQARVLADIRNRRHFRPAEFGLLDSALLLREDRGR